MTASPASLETVDLRMRRTRQMIVNSSIMRPGRTWLTARSASRLGRNLHRRHHDSSQRRRRSLRRGHDRPCHRRRRSARALHIEARPVPISKTDRRHGSISERIKQRRRRGQISRAILAEATLAARQGDRVGSIPMLPAQTNGRHPARDHGTRIDTARRISVALCMIFRRHLRDHLQDRIRNLR